MKANPIPTLTRTVVSLVLMSHITSAVALEASSTLSLTKTNASTASLSISNAGNQVWIISSSSNLVSWTPVESLKVFNGTYHRTYSNNLPGTLFYRAFYDPAQQNIASTTANALGLPGNSFNYAAPVLPANFLVNPILAEDNMRASNITTDAGATLGRVLFYDKRLSTNQTISCASCHVQSHGFSDPRQFSVGYDGSLGTRNAMGLSNARWYQRQHFFWDERATTLEVQTLQPIQNPIEMGMTLQALTNRLAAEPFYTNLFTLAFGSPNITTNGISFALAQFVRSIVSTQSKYDIGVTNNFANFTAQENLGRQIFFGTTGKATCAVCHATDNFVPTTTLNNNGLEFPYVDKGVGGVTGVTAQNGLFKVPSLRNIELTAPYMHDGRFTNLEQVVAFYNSGVVNNPNLSPPLLAPPPGGGPLRLNLSTDQQAALVAFLKTLTDTNLATDPKLSDPFNYGN